MSEHWLNAYAPGYRDLTRADRRAIMVFSFLWSLFEARTMDNSANPKRIRRCIADWAALGTLQAERYDEELAYFRARYRVDAALTAHFPRLNLRPNDYPKLVEAVICNASDDPQHRMLALLIIIWRLRNNLFHGSKWAYGFTDQRKNFIHANAVLVRILESHGGLA